MCVCYGLYWTGNNWPPQAKPYPPFGGKAPRHAAPVIQVEPVPVASAEAGAGEEKGGEKRELPQVFTPPPQHRALSARSVKAERARAARQKKTLSDFKHASTPATPSNVTHDKTDQTNDLPSSSGNEVIIIKANVLGNLHVQRAKDEFIIEQLTNEVDRLTDENKKLEDEVQELRGQVNVQTDVILGQPVPDTDVIVESIYLAVKHVETQVRNHGLRSQAILRQALIKVRSIQDEHIAAVNRDVTALVSQLTNELRPEGEGSPPAKAPKK